MNKAFILLAGAGIAYFFLKQKQLTAPAVPGSAPGPVQNAQPSNVYPFRAIQPPRVDNANQPWYNGSTAGMTGPNDSNALKETASSIGAIGTVVHSVGDIWGQFSDWFGGDDTKSNLGSIDELNADWQSGDVYAPDETSMSGLDAEFNDMENYA